MNSNWVFFLYQCVNSNLPPPKSTPKKNHGTHKAWNPPWKKCFTFMRSPAIFQNIWFPWLQWTHKKYFKLLTIINATLCIQSYSQLMIGVSNHLLSIVFRFHYHSQFRWARIYRATHETFTNQHPACFKQHQKRLQVKAQREQFASAEAEAKEKTQKAEAVWERTAFV